jgi:hypothetical protein
MRFSLPVENLRGQCYDGASSMSEQFKGVRARLQALQPKVLYVHCFAHSLNLCIQDAVRSVPLFRDIIQCLHDLSVVVRGSTKRKQAFVDIAQAVEGDSPTLPRPLCPTRWAVRFAAIDAAVRSYAVIIDFLNEVSYMATADNSAAKARGLASQLESGETYLALAAAKEVFALTDSLSCVLQSSTLCVSGGLSAIDVTLEQLYKMHTTSTFLSFGMMHSQKSVAGH